MHQELIPGWALFRHALDSELATEAEVGELAAALSLGESRVLGELSASITGDALALRFHDLTATAPLTLLRVLRDVATCAEPGAVLFVSTETGWRFGVAPGRRVLLGRDPASDIWVPDVSAARRQTWIDRTGPEILVEDAASTSGTWVDGHAVRGFQRVVPGSSLRAGVELEIRS